MKVIETIQSTISDQPPVDVTFYTGDSYTCAVAAVASILSDAEEQNIEEEYFKILAIRIEL